MYGMIPGCPECFGPWLNGWRWQHSATNCHYRQRDDATQAADFTRLASVGRTFTRPATVTEANLWLAVTGQELPANAGTTVHCDVVSSAWVRAINGHMTAGTAFQAHPLPPEDEMVPTTNTTTTEEK